MNTKTTTIRFWSLLAIFVALSLKSITDCPKWGSASTDKERKLNMDKNRAIAPSYNQIQRSVSLAALLNSKDDDSLFPPNTAAQIEGYIYGADEQKGESCNCNSDNPNDWNYTLYISNGKANELADCAITEITPAFRKIHPEWTLHYFKNLIGKQVKITGWMLFNYPETKNSLESHHNGFYLKRRTAWEIYPVTSISMDE